MKRQVVGLMIATTIVVLALVVVLFMGQQDARDKQGYLYQSVENRNAVIHSIDIRHGEARVKLLYRDSKWQIGEGSQAAGYEVDANMINGLIRFVQRARYLEKKTNQKDKLTKLGLAIDTERDSPSLGVSSGKGSERPTLLVVNFQDQEESVWIGNRSQSGLGTYVRLPNTSQAWLVSGEAEIPTESVGWIKRVFLNVDRSDIVRAKFISVTGESVLISAQSETESATIENLPPHSSLAYESVADSALSALINLRLLDLARVDQFSWAPIARASFELSSGETILIRCLEWKDEFWVSVSRANIVDRWAYRIDKYRYDQLTKKMNDYLVVEPAESE